MPTTIASAGRIGVAGSWAGDAGQSSATALYVVLEDTSDAGIEVWKSTDGTTWNQQDSANEPTSFGATLPFDSYVALGFIYVAYFTATSTVKVRRFDLSTDLWEASTIGTNASTSANNAANIALSVRSDGDVLLAFWEGVNLSHNRWEGASWGNFAIVGSSRIVDVVTDANDRTWFLFSDVGNADFTYRSLDSANAFGTQTDFDNAVHTSPVIASQAVLFNDGSFNKLAVLDRDTTGELDMNHGVLGTATLSAIAVTNAVSTSTSPLTTSVSLGATAGKIYAAWGTANAILYDSTTGLASPLTFGTDQTLLSGLADADVCPQLIDGVGAIGVLYQESGAVKVEWIIPPGISSDPLTGTVSRTANVTTPIVVDRVSANTTNRILIVGIAVAAETGTITAPAGFTLIQDTVFTGGRLLTYWHEVNNDPATWNFTTDFGSLTRTSSFASEYRGVDVSGPIDASTEQANGSSTSVTAPGLTPDYNEDMLVFVGAIANVSTWTPPTGFTEPTNGDKPAAANISIGVSYKPLASASATGDAVATSSIAGANAGQLIALKAAYSTDAPAGSAPSVGDTGTLTGTETVAVDPVALTRADTGTLTGTESLAETAVTSKADAGTLTGSETLAETAATSRADTGTMTGVEAVSVGIGKDVADTGSLSGSDSVLVPTVALTRSDAGALTGVEAIAVVVQVSLADVGTISGTETSALTASRAVADTGTLAGVDAIATSATIPRADTGTLSGVESLAESAAISRSDTGTLTGVDGVSADSGAATPVTVNDVGTLSGSEARSMAASLSRDDAGQLTGIGSFALIVAGSLADTGSTIGDEAFDIAVDLIVLDVGFLTGNELIDAIAEAVSRATATHGPASIRNIIDHADAILIRALTRRAILRSLVEADDPLLIETES